MLAGSTAGALARVGLAIVVVLAAYLLIAKPIIDGDDAATSLTLGLDKEINNSLQSAGLTKVDLDAPPPSLGAPTSPDSPGPSVVIEGGTSDQQRRILECIERIGPADASKLTECISR